MLRTTKIITSIKVKQSTTFSSGGDCKSKKRERKILISLQFL